MTTLLRIEDELLLFEFEERLNRFLVKLRSGGQSSLAHLRDPGRLKEILVPRAKVLAKRVARKGRKTSLEVMFVENGGVWVLVNSGLHNEIAAAMFEKGLVEEYRGYSVVRREFKLGKSRIDLVLEGRGGTLLVEVKGCTLVLNGVGLFPDAPTSRGARHLLELARTLERGFMSAVLFLIARPDVKSFTANKRVDPVFYEAFLRAHAKGVRYLAYSIGFDRDESRIYFSHRVPVLLGG